MTAQQSAPSARVEAAERRRPPFGIGLAAGLVGGMLVGAALTVATLMLLPANLLDTLRGDLPDAAPVVDTTASPTPTPLPTDAWPDTDTALPIDVTQPGTVVAVGDPAIVQLAGADGARTLVELTVTTIEPAPDKDQRTLREAAPLLTGQTVYYARLSGRWVAGDPLNSTAVGGLFTMLDTAGTRIPSLTLLDWRACESPSTPVDFNSAPEPTDWCIAAASPTAGLVPVGVRFSQPGGPYDSPDVDAGVRWTP